MGKSKIPNSFGVVVRGVVVSSRHRGRSGPPASDLQVTPRGMAGTLFRHRAPGATVAVDKSAVGRAESARPMQPKSIGLRSLTSIDLIDLRATNYM